VIIEEIAKTLITYESQPDGGRTAEIDPYDGCTIRCPYCFQLSEPDWNQNIHVNMGIDLLIDERLPQWPKDETIYFGSRCDPYMSLEAKYKLTRSCLSRLSKMEIPTMVCTKGNVDLIRRDFDVFQDFSGALTILLGYSRLGDYLNNKSKFLDRISLAQELRDINVPVWAFITPLLPGITDAEYIRAELSDDIPLFVDYLRFADRTPQSQGITVYIQNHFPELEETYGNLLAGGEQEYYEALRKKYHNDSRFTFLWTE
jgi:DNA repair photolyase